MQVASRNWKRQGTHSPLGSGGAQACQHLRFSPGRPVCRLLTSRTIIYVILSHLLLAVSSPTTAILVWLAEHSRNFAWRARKEMKKWRSLPGTASGSPGRPCPGFGPGNHHSQAQTAWVWKGSDYHFPQFSWPGPASSFDRSATGPLNHPVLLF